MLTCLDSLSVYTYHGIQRKRNVESLTSYDVILTTYTTLASDYKEDKTDESLFTVHWGRVILDEAHIIKEKGTKNAQVLNFYFPSLSLFRQ